MKKYMVTATLGTTFHEFGPVKAANKVEAINEVCSSLSTHWGALDGAVEMDSTYSPDLIGCTLADLFGQDLLDQIVENYCDVAQWEAVRVKK